MLDVTKLSHQLHEMSLELAVEASATSYRLTLVRDLLREAAATPEKIATRATEAWLADAPWPVAHPVEPLKRRLAPPPTPPKHTVVATDGSQIIPNHHEISSCFLLNVGRVLLTYGTGERPRMESQPFLHREEALLVDGRAAGPTEEVIGAQRTLAEMAELVKLADLARERGHPVLALVDGSLIHWEVEKFTAAFQEQFFQRWLDGLDTLRRWGIPVASYISNSRATEVVNLMRVQHCPYDATTCSASSPCPGVPPPCDTVAPTFDRQLWGSILPEQARSPLFKSGNRVLAARYAGLDINFFYVRVAGEEVARVEVPAWVGQDPAMLGFVHAAVVDQSRKGFGYPVALSEAHNMAVIRREDRAHFYALLMRRLLHRRLRVAVSNKELRKRRGMV